MGAVGWQQPSPGAQQRPRQPDRLRAPEPGLFLLASATAAKTDIIAAVSSLLSFQFLKIKFKKKNIYLGKAFFCSFIATPTAEPLFPAPSRSLLSAFLYPIPFKFPSHYFNYY